MNALLQKKRAKSSYSKTKSARTFFHVNGESFLLPGNKFLHLKPSAINLPVPTCNGELAP